MLKQLAVPQHPAASSSALSSFSMSHGTFSEMADEYNHLHEYEDEITKELELLERESEAQRCKHLFGPEAEACDVDDDDNNNKHDNRIDAPDRKEGGQDDGDEDDEEEIAFERLRQTVQSSVSETVSSDEEDGEEDDLEENDEVRRLSEKLLADTHLSSDDSGGNEDYDPLDLNDADDENDDDADDGSIYSNSTDGGFHKASSNSSLGRLENAMAALEESSEFDDRVDEKLRNAKQRQDNTAPKNDASRLGPGLKTPPRSAQLNRIPSLSSRPLHALRSRKAQSNDSQPMATRVSTSSDSSESKTDYDDDDYNDDAMDLSESETRLALRAALGPNHTLASTPVRSTSLLRGALTATQTDDAVRDKNDAVDEDNCGFYPDSDAESKALLSSVSDDGEMSTKRTKSGNIIQNNTGIQRKSTITVRIARCLYGRSQPVTNHRTDGSQQRPWYSSLLNHTTLTIVVVVILMVSKIYTDTVSVN